MPVAPDDRDTSYPPASPALPKPWPIGASLLWAVAATALQYGTVIMVVIAWGLLSGDIEGLRAVTPISPLVWFASILATPFQIALLATIVRRRGGLVRYCSLTVPDRGSVLVGGAAVAILVPLLDLATYALGRDVVPPFIIDAYRAARTAGALPVLIIAVAIAAPLWEELLFRGFLFRSFAARGPYGAVVFTSLIWAAMHVQYDWFGIMQVFVIGLALGWLRLRSGSSLLTIPLHMAANLIALAETAAKLEWLS